MDIYGSVSGYRVYHADRGRNEADRPDAAILASLGVASEYIDGSYQSAFPGLKVGLREQVREWPRQGAMDIYGYAIASDSVPREILNATYELAYKNIVTPGVLYTDYKPSKYKQASVTGAVAVTYNTFDDISEAQAKFPAVTAILAPVLTATGTANVSSLSGATTRV